MPQSELLETQHNSRAGNDSNRSAEAGMHNDSHAISKFVGDLNTTPGAFKEIQANNGAGKMPEGFEKNAPTIVDQANKDIKETQKDMQGLNRIEPWPKKEEPKAKDDSDNKNRNEKPGIKIPEGMDKNPIGEIPKNLRENPNPPMLGLPRMDNKPIQDIDKRHFENPNPPKLGQHDDGQKHKPGAKAGNGDSPKFIDFPPMDPKNPWWIMEAKK